MKPWNRLGWSSVTLAIVCTLLALTGCHDRVPAGRVEVTYWEKWTGFEDDAMTEIVDDFNKSQDRIFVKKIAVSEMLRKVMLATAGGNPPDIAGIWSSNIPDFAEKGALTPLNKMIDAAGIKSNEYISIYWDQCASHGFMWALPSTPVSLGLHWNKKLFREAGLDPNHPPQSMDELDAIADKLTIVEINRGGKTVRVRYPELTDAEKQAKKFNIIQIGHLPSQPGWWISMWVYWFNGNLWDGSHKITANSPENLETFEWFRKTSEKYGIDNLRRFGATFGNFASASDPFISGQVAMELQGVWMYNFINKFNPTLEWGAAPFPAKHPEKGFP